MIRFLVTLGLLGAGDSGDERERVDFFESRVRPVLVEHCHRCHGPEAKKLKGGLRVDSREALLAGGDSGPAVVPGDPQASRLVHAVRYEDVELQMPPKARLSDREVNDLVEWVRLGAPWAAVVAGAASRSAAAVFDLEARRREHWAWQPLRPAVLPELRAAAWPSSAVDAQVLARLEAAGLSPAAPAERRALARRMSFDLLGLPPEPDLVADLAADESPDAVSRLADRLLASPRFGERWGRHWLDVVRYADTRGHEFDYPIPSAFEYRDHVVRALNADVPYDQLVREHVAGDLIAEPRLDFAEGFNESILGTGFWFLGEEVHSPVDIRQDEADRVSNQIDVFAKAFLGLTVSCARCHDHKFDAISTQDYYALAGYLRSSSYRQVAYTVLEEHQALAERLASLRQSAEASLRSIVAAARREVLVRLADYLLAYRDLLAVLPKLRRAGDAGAVAVALAETATSAALDRIVAERALDRELLERWIGYLTVAAADVREPFHVWALLARRGTADADAAAGIVRPLVARWQESRAADSRALAGARVVVDFAALRGEDWRQDGFAFGSGPARAGELKLGADPGQPVVGVLVRAGARRDPLWKGPRLAPGVEAEPGKLGTLERPGRTLITPSFELRGGKLFYLVSGAGAVYAAVDSHRLIHGPLHARLVHAWTDAGAGKLRWVEHDLSPYRGQRLHLEFSPAGDSDLVLHLAVEAESAPPLPELPPQPIEDLVAGPSAGSPASLARGYQALFLAAMERFERGPSEGAESADWQRLADWAIQREPLLTRLGGEAAAKRRAAAEAFTSRQAEILRQLERPSRAAPALLDGSGEDEYVFIRGKHSNRGPVVPRRFLAALGGQGPAAGDPGSGRMDLARSVASASNPLFPRVAVNRVWHHLFGRGLVATTDDFGALGERPTHPELLDRLAGDFAAGEWSLKRLVRSLVLTSTYAMESRGAADADAADPRNFLLHRMRVRRLEAEAIRDSILWVSGRLDARMSGPAVPIHLTPFLDGRGRPESGALDGAGRRSLYLAVRRNFLSPFLMAFDAPQPLTSIGRRNVSNVPAQALVLMNDPFVGAEAQRWGRALASAAGAVGVRESVRLAYGRALCRPPSPEDEDAAVRFLTGGVEVEETAGSGSEHDFQRWADLCHVLFNLKGFIFVE